MRDGQATYLIVLIAEASVLVTLRLKQIRVDAADADAHVLRVPHHRLIKPFGEIPQNVYGHRRANGGEFMHLSGIIELVKNISRRRRLMKFPKPRARIRI